MILMMKGVIAGLAGLYDQWSSAGGNKVEEEKLESEIEKKVAIAEGERDALARWQWAAETKENVETGAKSMLDTILYPFNMTSQKWSFTQVATHPWVTGFVTLWNRENAVANNAAVVSTAAMADAYTSMPRQYWRSLADPAVQIFPIQQRFVDDLNAEQLTGLVYLAVTAPVMAGTMAVAMADQAGNLKPATHYQKLLTEREHSIALWTNQLNIMRQQRAWLKNKLRQVSTKKRFRRKKIVRYRPTRHYLKRYKRRK